MASIYDYETGYEITVGLQGSSVCNEAIQAASEIAHNRQAPVVLEDDDGLWYVSDEETRRLTDEEIHDGGWNETDRQE